MNKEGKKLPARARYNMLIADIIATFIVVPIAYYIKKFLLSLSFMPTVAEDILGYIFYIIVAWVLLDTVLTQLIGYNRIRYSISDKSVELIKGIVFYSREVVPIRRIQQVNIEQGPINQLFSLASVIVTTSGGELELENIELDEANQIAGMLRAKVNDFAKEAQVEAVMLEKSESKDEENQAKSEGLANDKEA